MSAPDPADVLFEDWRRRVDEGEPESPEALIEAHPEVADGLRERFDAVRLLEGALGASRPPRRIGEYVIVREIGRGGMGVVYEATQESLGRRVAVKVLYPSVAPAGNAVRRFRQEAQAAGRLKHTNIVAVHALGEEDGLWYCAMELVDGPPLAQVLDRLRRVGRPPGGNGAPSGAASTLSGAPAGSSDHYRRVARMFGEVADALETAHEAGVVHRDVKPSNLLLDSTGHLRLADFGLARCDEGVAHLTRTGDLLGTPLYMSPEQFRGPAEAVGPSTDVYSLGATLYEVLTLRPPHEAKETARLAAEVLARDPPPPRSLDPRIPRDLETVCLKALEKEPARRYETAAAFAEDLRSFAAGDAVRARRTGPLGRLARRVRRHPARVAVGAVLVAALAAATVLGSRGLEEGEKRRRAEYDLLLRRAVEFRPEDTEEGSAGAETLYAQAIALDDRRPDAHVARALAGGGTVEERLASVQAAAERGVPPGTAALLRAYVLTASGREAEAETEWRGAGTSAASEEPLARLVAGLRAALAQDPAGALAHYDAVLGTSPPDSVLRHLALTRRVDVLLRTGDLGRALEDVVRLRARGDDRIKTAALEAMLWRRLGKESEAESRFSVLLARVLRSERESMLLGRALQPSATWNWLERVTRPGIESYPRSAGLLRLHSEVLNAAGDVNGALAACDEAIGIAGPDAALDLLRAKYLGIAGRREEALAAAQQLATRHPDDVDVLLGVADIHRQSNDVLPGTRAAERALALDPRSVEARRILAHLRILERRFVEADELLTQAIAVFPRHPGLHRTVAALRGTQGRHEEALEALDRAEAIEPANPDHERMRGITLFALARHREAADAYRRALTLRPGYAAAWGGLGRTLQELKDWDGAIDAWHRVRALDPTRAPDAWNEIGVAYKLKGDLVRADEAFRKVLEFDADDLEALSNLAATLCDAGKPAEALPLFDRLVARVPTDAVILFNRGIALEQTGKVTEALDAYATAARLDPKDPRTLLRSGTILFALGRKAEAADAFEKATRIAPNDGELHFDLAVSRMRIGDRAGAKVAVLRAVALRPDHAESHGLLSGLLAQEGDMAAAVEEALTARRLAPQDFRHATDAAVCLHEAGRHGAAADAFLLAAERFPDNAYAQFACAWYLVTAPDRAVRAPSKAVAHARRAVELDPNDVRGPVALGAALCAAERFAEGIRTLEELLARSKDADPKASYLLAMAYHRTDRNAEARAAFDRAAVSLRSDPDDNEESRRLEAEAAEVLGIPVPK